MARRTRPRAAAPHAGTDRLTERIPDIRWPAPPSPAAAWAFDRYLRRLAGRHLAGCWWRRTGEVGDLARGPVLAVANHTNWWDGFLACLLTRRLGLRFQILMEARHLLRYRTFLRVGALPIRRGQPRDARRDLESSRRSLVPGTALWIFPQGSRRPAAEPIGTLEEGAGHLLATATEPVTVLPVAFRYAYRGEQLPEAFVSVGPAWTVAAAAAAEMRPRRRAITQDIAGRMRATIADLDARIATEDVAGFAPLVPGRLSINKRLDRLRHALGMLDGPFTPRNG